MQNNQETGHRESQAFLAYPLFPLPCSLSLSSAVGDRRQLVEYFSVLE